MKLPVPEFWGDTE